VPFRFYTDWFPSAQFAGIYVAIDKGFYKEAGLDVTVIPFEFGANPIGAMDREPNMAALGTMEGYIFMQRRAKQADIRALSAVLRQSPAGFMSLDSEHIHSATDFVGKKVGIHKYADPLYLWFLRRAGVPQEAAPFQFVENDLSLLTTGKFDVMQGYAIDEFIRFKRLVGDRASFISFHELGFDTYAQIVFTTSANWSAHEAADRAFIKATREGWAYALQHPQESVASVTRRAEDDGDRAFQVAMIEALKDYISPRGEEPLEPLSAAKWERMEHACVEMGFMKTIEDPARVLIDPLP
jgi:ABC-type nitrate/sulfonate/bicarbonate transport system substrate-binding protein